MSNFHWEIIISGQVFEYLIMKQHCHFIVCIHQNFATTIAQTMLLKFRDNILNAMKKGELLFKLKESTMYTLRS